MEVLLVEDDLGLVQALGRALAGRGFSLVSCSDGLEALTLCQRRRFDAIVLDLSLPDIDGLVVLDRLRGRDDRTPVLILTARGAVNERVTGLNAGADDYLAKPFDLDELDARLRALIRRHQGEGDLRCGRLRLELEATWHGGTRVLEKLEQGRFDPVAARPKLGIGDGLVIAWRMLSP